MSQPNPPPAGVQLRPAAADDAPVLANLLELYAHDFSEIMGLELGDDGRFGYPRLASYWRDDGRFPFLVTVDGRLAGFALVGRGSHLSGDPAVWDVEEFFVARGYRRRGIGAAVARELWRRFRGRWEVRVMEANLPAIAFWAAAIAEFIGRAVPPVFAEAEDRRWQVFAFDSSGTA